MRNLHMGEKRSQAVTQNWQRHSGCARTLDTLVEPRIALFGLRYAAIFRASYTQVAVRLSPEDPHVGRVVRVKGPVMLAKSPHASLQWLSVSYLMMTAGFRHWSNDQKRCRD
jgi:hypothetical protein